MCRLFGQISPRPADAGDLLADSEFSLLKQSNFDKRNLQRDGWGIAYFGNEHRVVVSKSRKPAYMETEKFRALSRASSRSIIGHIRAASNPRGLPRTRLISRANSQPFTDGRWIFAHNGTLQIPDEVAENLGPYRRRLKSLNDSEVYFWQFVKFQERLKDVAGALAACVGENLEIWRKCRDRHPDKKTPYTSLNAIISDGRTLHAFNHFVGKPGRGLCNPTQSWGVMSWTRRGGRLVVASENLDRGRWLRFNPPELLSAEIHAGRLTVGRRSMEVASR